MAGKDGGKRTWLEVAFFDGDALTEWVAAFDGEYVDGIIQARPDAFVKLDCVRWLDPVEGRIRTLGTEPIGTGDSAWVSRRSIVRVIPLREDATFWAEARVPAELEAVLGAAGEYIDLDDDGGEESEAPE